jgi:hypothetical protein
MCEVGGDRHRELKVGLGIESRDRVRAGRRACRVIPLERSAMPTDDEPPNQHFQPETILWNNNTKIVALE